MIAQKGEPVTIKGDVIEAVDRIDNHYLCRIKDAEHEKKKSHWFVRDTVSKVVQSGEGAPSHPRLANSTKPKTNIPKRIS